MPLEAGPLGPCAPPNWPCCMPTNHPCRRGPHSATRGADKITTTTEETPMPVNRVTIEFGGLCLFVQKTVDPIGLFVLMPVLEMPGMRHCQMIRATTPDGKLHLIPFGGRDWD